MNNQLQIFNNDMFGNIRGLEINGECWLVGKDVTNILEYQNGSRDIARHVDEEDKSTVAINDGSQNRNMVVINESGLYSLILRSDMPRAKEFKRWVTSEVLPQIRKTGGYIPIEAEMSEAEIMARALQISQRTIEQKDKLLKEKEVELVATKGELEDKNRFIGQISASKTSMLVRDVAHLVTKNNIKIGEKRLWMKLREWGLIFKESTKPKQRALEQGLFEVSQFAIQTNHGVTTKATTRVTAKGQVYIINRLLQEGI